MDRGQITEALEFALDVAGAAGRLTLGYFGTSLAVETKSDATPVTIADRRAEALLRERIEKHFPDHGIVGEEFGEQPGRADARWILDPIDGTYSFIHGVPLFANLIGLEWQSRMVLGVINLPAIGHCVFAGRGLGCFQNDFDTPAHVSDVADLSAARVSVTSHKLLAEHGRDAAYRRLLAACSADRGWPDAYAYALLATGRHEVVVDPIMSLWDIAPLAVVVTEAGGTLTDWDGRPTHNAAACIATNRLLLPQVLGRIGRDGNP